jgi:hypothetical protein
VQLRKPYPLLRVSAAQPIGTGDAADDAAFPHVAVRSGWPTRRVSKVGYLVTIVVITGAVLVSLVHRPSSAERAEDLRGFTSDMQADIGSCAADVGASLIALRAVEGGASSEVRTARAIATSGAADCSPVNDELLVDLVQYEVTESLSSFGLNRAVTGLMAWAADAERAQTDIAGVLSARTDQARGVADAVLGRAMRVLDTQRASVDAIIRSASNTLSAHAAPPRLPG